MGHPWATSPNLGFLPECLLTISVLNNACGNGVLTGTAKCLCMCTCRCMCMCVNRRKCCFSEYHVCVLACVYVCLYVCVYVYLIPMTSRERGGPDVNDVDQQRDTPRCSDSLNNC